MGDFDAFVALSNFHGRVDSKMKFPWHVTSVDVCAFAILRESGLRMEGVGDRVRAQGHIKLVFVISSRTIINFSSCIHLSLRSGEEPGYSRSTQNDIELRELSPCAHYSRHVCRLTHLIELIMNGLCSLLQLSSQ